MGGPSAESSDEAVIQFALLDQRLHRALLDELDEGVCMVDRDHRIGYWNRIVYRNFGADAEPADTIDSLEERVGQVYEGCRASEGDRTAMAHLSGNGAKPCLPS
jgi:PAS domain-containing protein